MTFSDQQLSSLRRSVSPRRIRTRTADQKEIRYIEGWFVISEANRIFGFDGWDRETVESKCLQARDTRGGCYAIYSARVRITVRSTAGTVVREGLGSGEGHANRLAEAHDFALKAAETYATKRALVTFGKAFGLSLYNDRRKNASRPRMAPRAHLAPAPETSPGSNVNSRAPTSRQERLPEPSPALNGRRIDKSRLTHGEPRRIRDKEHLGFVAAQACLACGKRPTDAHNVRFAQPRALGVKVSDEFTVPLCRVHHSELHAAGNEKAWWHEIGIDPLAASRELWKESQGSPAAPAPASDEKANVAAAGAKQNG